MKKLSGDPGNSGTGDMAVAVAVGHRRSGAPWTWCRRPLVFWFDLDTAALVAGQVPDKLQLSTWLLTVAPPEGLLMRCTHRGMKRSV